MRQVDARLLDVRQPHRIVVSSELARMLLVIRGHRYLIADVLDQLARIHDAVVVCIGRAFESFDDVIAEHTMPAAELGAFERDFFRSAGQQAEQVAFDVAQVLNIRAHRGVVNGADRSRFADIDEQQHAADLGELLFETETATPPFASAVLFRSWGSES